MQTRDQEPSFGTKIYDILFNIDEDISPWKKRKVIRATLYLATPGFKVMGGWKLSPFWFQKPTAAQGVIMSV